MSENLIKKEILVQVDSRIEKLIPQFLAIQNADVESMKRAFQKFDYEQLQHLGHKMKGSCGGYGFHELGRMGAKIEMLAVAKNPEVMTEQIAALQLYLSTVKIQYVKK